MKRDKYTISNTLGMFDYLKGIIMILIMLFHTYGLMDYVSEHEAELNIAIETMLELMLVFSESLMPILFIISGYGFRSTTMNKCFKKQFKLLIVPYVITSVVTLIIHMISYYLLYGGIRFAIKNTFYLFIGFLFGFSKETELNGVVWPTCGPVWFLLALFIGMLVFNLLLKWFEGKKLLAISFVISCVGWGLSFLNILPWCISQGLVSTLYICFGYLAKKNKFFIIQKRKDIIVVFFLCITILDVFMVRFGYNNMAINQYACGPLSIVVSGMMGLMIIYIFLQLNRFNGVFVNFIRKIGRYSLYVLCIHTVEIMAIGRYLQYDFVNKWEGSVFIRSIIVFGCRATVVIILTFGYMKIKDYCMNRFLNRSKL